MAAKPDFADTVREALKRRGRTIVFVQGRSMYPVLRHGARVEIRPVALDELRPGDLVVFSNGRALICHRLIRKSKRLCFLKGDTNLWMDPPVVWAQVIGRVSCVIDEESRILPVDTQRLRLAAQLLARLSYPYALYYNALHWLGGCHWWAKGIEFQDPPAKRRNL